MYHGPRGPKVAVMQCSLGHWDLHSKSSPMGVMLKIFNLAISIQLVPLGGSSSLRRAQPGKGIFRYTSGYFMSLVLSLWIQFLTSAIDSNTKFCLNVIHECHMIENEWFTWKGNSDENISPEPLAILTSLMWLRMWRLPYWSRDSTIVARNLQCRGRSCFIQTTAGGSL
jgi:hypothetical protein